MYGVIIEGLRHYVETHFSREFWIETLKKAGIRNENFSTHERYSERLAPNILKTVAEVSGLPPHEVGVLAGMYFIRLMTVYNYDKLLRVLGRRFPDFIKGLDNLHEYFRLSYPKIRPPSFYCEREDSKGIVLHYRSRRPGYTSYVIGLLIEIAKTFYDVDLNVSITKQDIRRGILYSVLRLDFDNEDYREDKELKKQSNDLNAFLHVDAVTFLDMFPFYIVFNRSLTIQLCGRGLEMLLPNLHGKKIDEEFNLLRPVIRLTWEGVSMHTNNIFKLESYKLVRRKAAADMLAVKINDVLEDKVEMKVKEDNVLPDDDISDHGRPVVLRGQMLKIRQSDVFIYLASCEVENLDLMYDLGAFVSDYSISDCNRDMIMTTVQQSDDLKSLLKSEREKSLKLNQVIKMTEIERRQAKRLLAQKMPKSIADQLTSVSALERPLICQAYSDTSIVALKVVDFDEVIFGWTPAEVVTMLNRLYSLIDTVVERHGTYKVENVYDTSLLACGVSPKTQFHAEYLADTAMDLLNEMKSFSTLRTAKNIEIKMGMYSGTVLAGVVGVKSPRYCMFGEVVNCAGKLEGLNSVNGTVLIGDVVYEHLENLSPGVFTFTDRGIIRLKGKGKIQTYSISNKSLPPRANTEKLIPEEGEEEESDEDDLEDQYTPVEEMESSASSTTSRMSISRSLYGSRATGSSMSQRSDRSGEGDSPTNEDAVSEKDDLEKDQSAIDDALDDLQRVQLSSDATAPT